jgi:hypothetical protein
MRKKPGQEAATAATSCTPLQLEEQAGKPVQLVGEHLEVATGMTCAAFEHLPALLQEEPHRI